MSATVTAPTRRQMIADRQKNSAVWRVIHWLGSLQLALILLATIAIAIGAATFTEANFNTTIARAYIYRAPWFFVWLIVLCVNLFAVTLTRWPWQRKHIGFVVTHYGIITLLAGAMIGMQTGFEGNVTLRQGEAPVSRITSSHSIISFQSPADSALYFTGFDAEAKAPSVKRPSVFPIPETSLKIVVDDSSANVIREQRLEPSDGVDAAPGVLLRLSSKMAGQTLDVPLVLAGGQPAEEDFFGMAHIHFLPQLAPGDNSGGQEIQMVFAKAMPVIQSGSAASGISVRLNEDGTKVTIISPEGTGATYLRKDILGQAVPEAGAIVTVRDFWPDFMMKEGKPATKSDQPNNPAILVSIVKAGAPDADTKPSLDLAPSADGVDYQLRRGGQAYASGSAKPGDTFNLGWADWQAEVRQVLPQCGVVNEVKPGPKLPQGTQGIPGFRAHLVAANGERGPDRWVESGQVTALVQGSNVVSVGYGLETKPLPFTMRLVKFEVPRDEGTDTPSNFLATVEFKDNKTGETKIGVAQMNHPASFPGTLWANLTGINYKFSQAEWNPRNLQETTLQVLYDPGWLLKWIGSLGICLGIAIMFYWKPGGA